MLYTQNLKSALVIIVANDRRQQQTIQNSQTSPSFHYEIQLLLPQRGDQIAIFDNFI